MKWVTKLRRYNRLKRIKSIRKVLTKALRIDNPRKLKLYLVYYFGVENLVVTETFSYNYVDFETKSGNDISISRFHLIDGLREAIKEAYLDKIKLEF